MTLHVKGEIDLSSAPLLEQELSAAQASDARDLVVDLDRVEFIDATGLGVLIRHSRRHPSLRITQGSQPVKRLLKITGLGDSLRCERSAPRPARPPG